MMNKRIFALLICAVITLVGCSKLDDGLVISDTNQSTNETTLNEGDFASKSLADNCESISYGCSNFPFVILPETSNLNYNFNSDVQVQDSYNFGFEYFVNSSFNGLLNLYQYNECPNYYNWKVFDENNNLIYTKGNPAFTTTFQSGKVYRVTADLVYGDLNVIIGSAVSSGVVQIDFEFSMLGTNDTPHAYLKLNDILTVESINIGTDLSGCGTGGGSSMAMGM